MVEMLEFMHNDSFRPYNHEYYSFLPMKNIISTQFSLHSKLHCITTSPTYPRQYDISLATTISGYQVVTISKLTMQTQA